MLSIQRLTVALALLAITAFVAPAKDGRDFAGFYSLSNSVRTGNQVRVTVTLQLFNYSGSDVDQAAVLIRPAPPETTAYATYSPIERWRNNADVKFVMHLTIPREEYLRWGAQRQPAVYVVQHDEQGREREHTVQVSRRPTISLDVDPDAQ